MSGSNRERLQKMREELEAKKKKMGINKSGPSRPAPASAEKSTKDLVNEVLRPVAKESPKEEVKVEPKASLTLEPNLSSLSIDSKPRPTTVDKDTQDKLERPKASLQSQQDDLGRSPSPLPQQESNEPAEEQPLTEDQIREQRARVLASIEFNDFVSKSTKLVEKALNKNILKSQKEEILSHLCTFPPLPSNSNTCVGCLEWSPMFKELMMASYIPHRHLNESTGTICLWSLALQSRPEFVLDCHSPATSIAFNKFDHNLVVAGSYSGQIIVWDLRKKLQPVLKTAMMAESHSHPVYCLCIVGSQFANNIVSASTDGKVCVWSLSMFNSPTSSFEMKNKVKDVGCTTMAFPETETNLFFMGAEDGSLIQSQLHGNRIMDNETDVFEGHFGPITGLDLQKYGDGFASDYASGLLLSSSVDWTVKLWSPKISKTPLLSFEIYDDYVFDVKWNPRHPSKFAAIDGVGHLDLWDLNKDVEHPEHRESTGNHVLNKLSWSNDGERLSTGNSLGEITVYNMGKDYTAVRKDELSRLERNITLYN